ncbi:MAG TPA: thioredoxin family protein [Gaiellaceae bacterium]
MDEEHVMTVAASAPQLVFFYSPRSGQSRRADGYLAQVLQRRHNHETFTLVRVDVDQRADLAERFGITTTPALLVIADGTVQARLSDLRGCRAITEMLRPWLK